MAKKKFNEQATIKPVVGLETSSEEITPTDVGAVEELGFVDGTVDGTLEPISESGEIVGDGTGEALPVVVDGGEAVLSDTTTLVDTEQLGALKDTDGVLEPINPDVVPEQDKVSSVAQVMDRAQNDSRVDTTVAPDDGVADEEPLPVTTTTDISAIIKRDDLKLLEKIELISKALGGVAGSVINSLLALYLLGSKTITRQPDAMNREQRALVRYFIRFSTQTTTEEFNFAMKYINWVYKQLTDEKVLDSEQLTLVRGVSPLDPTNSTIFIAGKDDSELITFVYLITVIDVKANAKTPSEKSRPIDIGKTTANTLITEEIVNKINNFYTL
jgi:hypothetical protein